MSEQKFPQAMQVPLDEQLGNLRKEVLGLRNRLERMEQHTHDKLGRPVVGLTLYPW